MALNDEVRPVTTPAGEATFALTEAAVHRGDRQLVWQDASYHHAQLHAFLGRWIYRDRTLIDLVRPAVWGGLGGLPWASSSRFRWTSRGRANGGTDDG